MIRLDRGLATPRRLGRAVGTLWHESSAAELARLFASPGLLSPALPKGSGHPVLLIPGFASPDASLLLMARWLRSRRYSTHRSRVGLNTACSETQCSALEERLERIAATGGRVAIVGHSRGGILAKALAAARPDLVAGIVTLGAPTAPTARTAAPARAGRSAPRFVADMVRSGHLPDLRSRRCLTGTCPTRFRDALKGGFPASVGFVAVYSRADRIAPWRWCRDPAAAHVEVAATHLGLAHNRQVYPEVLAALGGFW